MKIFKLKENILKSKELADAVKQMTAVVAKGAKGKIIPFVSRVGNTTSFGYSDSKGVRNTIFSTDKKLSKEEEEKIIKEIRQKYSELEEKCSNPKSKKKSKLKIKSEEADGSMGDLGAPPSDYNPKLRKKYKLKDEEEADEAIADKNMKNKKLALKKSKAKSKIHCTGNKTPEIVPTPGNTIKYKCTIKDQKKSREMKKVAKANKTSRKKGSKSAVKTRKFRAK